MFWRKERNMRPIKFRGKDSNSGEWFYGNLFVKDARGRTHISTPERGSFRIDPDTVGQFTGMLDKNGKEIYEGDILKGHTNKWNLESKPAPHEFVGYVRWESQCDVGLQWVLTSMDSMGSSPLNWYAHCCAIDYSTGVIIGNIHDNPELLKGGEV